MTRSTQKKHERFFAEKAAECLKETWSLGPDRADSNPPDFIVTDGARQFGLEVCNVFTGQQSAAGSHMKRKESETQRIVNNYRREYESNKNIPLNVRFVGDMCAENMAEVLPALVAKDFSRKQLGYQETIIVDKGNARLCMFVTRTFQGDWYSVNDRAGRVNRDPKDHIAEEIKKKSKKLPRYKECAGLDEIHLLIVANRIMNSGKLLLEKSSALDLRGFQVVYFFSYPETVTIFD